MHDTAMTMANDRDELGFWDRTATVAAWAVGGALFLTVGWFAVQPDDPLGAVSMLTRTGPVAMFFQSAALAAVVAAIATVVAGRQLVDIGTCAAALGLALVSLRGETAAFLLVQQADGPGGLQRGLGAWLAIESIAWFGVVVVAAAVAAVVTRWLFGAPDATDENSKALQNPTVAGCDLPLLGSKLSPPDGSFCTSRTDGLKHTGIAVIATILLINILSTGLERRSIQHGQACFVVGAAVWVAAYVAHRMYPVRSALWTMLAVGLVAVLGYLWAAFQLSPNHHPAPLPPTLFLRILPIQHIAVGTVAAIAGMWSWYVPRAHSCEPDRPSIRRPVRRR